MQDIVANVDSICFDIERDLELQVGAKPLPFSGMDKSGSAICYFHQRGTCQNGSFCPFRHVRGDRTVVCKHWLRGLCKKGDDCEFLHEFDMTKMPECYFYTRFGTCANRECPFLHIDPEAKRIDCPWYDRGFCRHGSTCKNRHVRRVLCINYLCGFCFEGKACKYVHARFDVPGHVEGIATAHLHRRPKCHNCGELGHVVWKCWKLSEKEKLELNEKSMAHKTEETAKYWNSLPIGARRGDGPPPSAAAAPATPVQTPDERAKHFNSIVCYKCGLKGHYANRCVKGHLAFLSHRPPNMDFLKAAEGDKPTGGDSGGDNSKTSENMEQ